MAVVWVELEPPDRGSAGRSAVRPRQVQRLAGLLGVPDGTRAAGYLTRLQAWAAEHAPDGSLTGRSARTIARAAGWRGDPETLVAALAGAGYLQRRPGGTRLLGLPVAAPSAPPVAPPGQSTPSPTLPIAAAAPLPGSPPGPARLHVSGLWAAALRELAGMVNEANFEAFLKDTIGLYQNGDWITVGVPSAYVQEVLAQRFRTAIDCALYGVSGLPLHVRLILLPTLPPTLA